MFLLLVAFKTNSLEGITGFQKKCYSKEFACLNRKLEQTVLQMNAESSMLMHGFLWKWDAVKKTIMAPCMGSASAYRLYSRILSFSLSHVSLQSTFTVNKLKIFFNQMKYELKSFFIWTVGWGQIYGFQFENNKSIVSK